MLSGWSCSKPALAHGLIFSPLWAALTVSLCCSPDLRRVTLCTVVSAWNSRRKICWGYRLGCPVEFRWAACVLHGRTVSACLNRNHFQYTAVKSTATAALNGPCSISLVFPKLLIALTVWASIFLTCHDSFFVFGNVNKARQLGMYYGPSVQNSGSLYCLNYTSLTQASDDGNGFWTLVAGLA